MALAFDATSNVAFATSGAGFSWTHVCTGSNLILVVGIAGAGADQSPNGVISGITYNGVSMTQGINDYNAGSGRDNVSLWYLINPSTGSHTIAVTTSVSLTMGGGAISLTGALQSGQPDATQHSTETSVQGTTVSQTITTVANNAWIIDGMGINSATSTLSNNQPGTLRQNVNGLAYNLGMQTYPKATAGAQSISWDVSAGSSASGSYVSLSVAPAPTTQISSVSGVAQASITSVSGVTNANIKSVSGVVNQ